MAIKPGIGRSNKNKNPPIFSHEFVIQNHADIVSCVAMVFVVGLMLQATSHIGSVFIAMHHNVTGPDHPDFHRGMPILYESGWKDYCAVFFYMLICVIMHAILQEYVLDKISKKLHLSKYKLSRFNDAGQLVVFYGISSFWGLDVLVREGFLQKISLVWEGFPNHPMVFFHKLFFIIQLAYYLHMLPELYFQRIKKEDQQEKIIHAISGFSIVALSYFFNFQRIGLLLLTLHYLGEMITYIFQLVEICDKDEKYRNVHIVNKIVFVTTRLVTMMISVFGLFYGIGGTEHSKIGLIAFFVVCVLQGKLITQFFKNMLKAKRESQTDSKSSGNKKKQQLKGEKSKREGKRESDLPEADQNHAKVDNKKSK